MVLNLLLQLLTLSIFAQEDFHFKPAGCEDVIDVKIFKNPIIKNDLVIKKVDYATYSGPSIETEKSLITAFRTLGDNLAINESESDNYKENLDGKYLRVTIKNLHEGFTEFESDAFIHLTEFKKVMKCLGEVQVSERIAALLEGQANVGENLSENNAYENESRIENKLDSKEKPNHRKPAGETTKEN